MTAGAVFWSFKSGMKEPQGLLTNQFRDNRAMYSADYATGSVYFNLSTLSETRGANSSFYVSEYETPIVVNAVLLDYYGQQVLSDNETFVQIELGGEFDCGDNLPSVSGLTVQKVESGATTFEFLFGLCIPGGFMTVKVNNMISGTSSLTS